jgi:tetratricopeptide (TPR) repeat protein
MTDDLSLQQIGQAVGAKLRAARLARKFTQSQLASPDFSVSYVSAIERGQIQPSLRALEIFAQRLGLSSSDLLSKQTSREISGFSAANVSVQNKEAIELQFLEAQILIRQGVSRQAITDLRNLTSYTLTPLQEIRLRYLLGWAYYNLDLFQESESVLAEALKLAKIPDNYLGLHILNLLGMVHASMHNHTQGLEYQQRCLDFFEKEQQPRDVIFMAQVCTNMGLHYIHLDKVDEAIQMFQKALTMTEEFTTPDQLSSMYWNAARYCSETKDYYYATLYGYKSLQLDFQEYSNSLRREIYHFFGRVMMKGDQQRTPVYLEKWLQDASVKQDNLTLAGVTTNMAEWLLRQGKVEEAHEHAQKAYELSSPYGDGSIAAYALIVLGDIEYAKKVYKKGDTHYVAGLEMFERLGARDELADQYAYYAQLLEERGKAKEALKYYKKALEIHR